MNREPSTAFDRIANATEAELYDADPAGYRPPVWAYPPSPYDVPAWFRNVDGEAS